MIIYIYSNIYMCVWLFSIFFISKDTTTLPLKFDEVFSCYFTNFWSNLFLCCVFFSGNIVLSTFGDEWPHDTCFHIISRDIIVSLDESAVTFALKIVPSFQIVSFRFCCIFWERAYMFHPCCHCMKLVCLVFMVVYILMVV